MSGRTGNLNLPYPSVTDPPDGANQIEELAEAVDSAIQRGTVTVTVSASVTGTGTITFPRPFTTPPVVVVSGSNSFYTLSVSNVTAAGCTVAARDIRGTSNSATIAVQWQAVGASAQ